MNMKSSAEEKTVTISKKELIAAIAEASFKVSREMKDHEIGAIITIINGIVANEACDILFEQED